MRAIDAEAYGRSSAKAQRNSRFGRWKVARANSIAFAFASIPVTSAPIEANRSATTPDPQPTSRTRSPGMGGLNFLMLRSFS